MTPLERAERAKQLLDDPVFVAAMDDVRMRLVAQLEQTAIGDIDTHHQAALALQMLKSIKDQIARYAAEIEIDNHRQKQDSFMHRMRERLA